ncbi:hypothetical protein Agub_g405 [Astrephomene gubernaculifera]|uniref:separase n=1 Tax=Astrephomene gubernaculifera TaxID=47775 RepID=A0AAD3DDS1_9CHLO|nr:hypothetical protein Agub_g405 [Astrephomene gubernaculifera]
MAAEGQALLAVLETETKVGELKEALSGIQLFLEPLLVLGSASQPNAEALRPVARTTGPLVTRLVKCMGNRLVPALRQSPEQLRILSEAACLGLDALDCLHPVIKASRHELDVQRYNFVRKLAALGLHDLAMEQGKVLHTSAASGPGSVAGPGDLHIAAVANLLVCYCELVHLDPTQALALWKDVYGPVDGLLRHARDAGDPSEAAKRLEPVLKCLCRVLEKLQSSDAICSLGPSGIAQQLTALLSCAALCRQEHVVQQMLLDDAAAAATAVQVGMAEAILAELTLSGSLPQALSSLLHQLALGLLQKRAAMPVPSNEGSVPSHPLAAAVQVALQLPKCVLSQQAPEQLPTLLAMVSGVDKALGSITGDVGQRWLRWTCLDVLRVSVASVLTQVVSTPQSTGGQLPTIALCMERLSQDSTDLLTQRYGSAAVVGPSGCSASAIAVRLLTVQRTFTGQLALLQDDVARNLSTLRQLMQLTETRSLEDGVEGLGVASLQTLSALLGNAGLDLLQAQHARPAVELLQFSAELAIDRTRRLQKQDAATTSADASQLVKKCKAHVTALQQLSEHTAAMEAAAAYVAGLHEVLGGNVGRASSLVKLHVLSNVAAVAAATVAPPAPQPPPSELLSPVAAASVGPVAPCKAPRRGGRLQRMQTETQCQPAKACSGRTRKGKASPEAADGAASAALSGSASATAAEGAAVRSLAQALSAAVKSGHAPASMLDSLDMYATQELELAAEECRRRNDGDAFQQQHTASVLGALAGCADAKASDAVFSARMLLVKALSLSNFQEDLEDDLRTACSQLNQQLAKLEQRQGFAAKLDPGLVDSTALACALLGVWTVRGQLARRARLDSTEAVQHLGRAIGLWEQLLQAHRSLPLRLPQATLQVALEVQQLLHLHGCTHADVAARCGPVVWQLMHCLSEQVKLREQQAYMLHATMPGITCLGRAITVQPHPSLAEAATNTQHSKLVEVLQLMRPVRDAYSSDPVDHPTVAAAADACSRELERSTFLRHGPAPLLLRSHSHQIAAAAYLRAGDTVNAYVHSQEALRITCSLFASLECPLPLEEPGAVQAARPEQELTPAEAAAAAVQSGAATSAQDYTVQEDDEQQESSPASTMEGTGGSGPAKCADNMPRQSVSLGLACAVAAAHLTSLHQAARVFEAAGCAEDAMSLWKECSRASMMFGAVGVQALCGCYLSELCARCGDADAAKAHLDAASTAVEQLQEASDRTPKGDAGLLRLHVCSARARIALLGQHDIHADVDCVSGISACERFLQSTAAGKHQVASCTGLGSCTYRAQSWHAVSLRSQLHRLRAASLRRLGRLTDAAEVLRSESVQLQEAAATCCGRSAAEVWPVDYGLLLAQEGGLVSSVAHGNGGLAAVVGLGQRRSAPSGVRLSGTCDGQQDTDQAPRKGGKAKASGVCRKDLPKQQHGQEDATMAHTVLCGVPALLLSLRLCWQVPLAAAYPCRQLLRASMALGLPHAATLFLHLGHGMSYAQQQALQRRQQQRTLPAPKAPAEYDSAAPPAQSAPMDVCADDASVEDEGGLSNAGKGSPQDVRDAALQMLSGLISGGCSGDALSTALERGAETWLQQALRLMPARSIVAIVTQDDEAGEVLLGRATSGSVPLLASLGGSGPSANTEDGNGRSPSGSGGSASTASSMLGGCVARLRTLLEESGDSMHMDQDAALSQSHKAKWWKARTSLDQGVKVLLQELDSQCLGPWRCLLLPVPDHHRGVLEAAAAAFVQESLLSLADQQQQPDESDACPQRMRLLQELLVVAMSNMQHLQGEDLVTLLRTLCSQCGLPSDPVKLQALATQLMATEAAVRVQLLCLPTSGQHGGHTSPVGPAEGDGDSAGSAGGGKLGAKQTPRDDVAPCVGARTRAQAGTSAASKPAAIEAVRRTRGTADTQPVSGGLTKPALAGRGVARLAVMQPEPSSSMVATRAAARGAGTRVASRARTAGTMLPADEQPEPKVAQSSQAGRARPGTSSATAAAATAEAAPATMGGPSAQPNAGPVLLVLGPNLHALPWESIPCCQGGDIYRILSLPVACATVSAASSWFGAAQKVEASGGRGSPCSAVPESCGVPSLPPAYYLLNPSGDLVDTQHFFQPMLEAESNWQGLIGERPTARALLTALQSYDLFMYFGHGSGEQFLPLPAMRKLQRSAACLLMGCSSGRLRVHGAYDPTGAVVAYQLAGCPALVANLWDVTDRDIDRYCQALMQRWLGCQSASTGGAAVGHSSNNSSMDSQKAVDLSPAIVSKCEVLGLATARSRSACKLPYLIGAAPVCYGLPLQLVEGRLRSC